MKKIAIMMADGCEEIEALTVVDMIRRYGKIEIVMVSISKDIYVTGSHNIKFMCDEEIDEVDFEEFDAIVLPGGMPGTNNLKASKTLISALKKFKEEGKLLAAICAAPSVLGENNLTNGLKVTSYPGFEKSMLGATYLQDRVVRDGNVITSRGMGTAIDFAGEIIDYFEDGASDAIKKSIMY